MIDAFFSSTLHKQLMPTEFICIPPICESQPESIFSHCRFNLLGDANSMAQPAQIERCNKGMTDSLSVGHGSPRSDRSASCSPYCSLGMRRKESRTGYPAFLSKFIVIAVNKSIAFSGGKKITGIRLSPDTRYFVPNPAWQMP